MPTYDFQCTDCSNEFQVFCKISEMENPHPCPSCGKTKPKRLIKGAPMVSMNGQNFSASKSSKSGFNEVLSNIHQRTAGSQLDKTTKI